MTLNITSFNTTSLKIMTLSVMTFRITALSITTLEVMTISTIAQHESKIIFGSVVLGIVPLR